MQHVVVVDEPHSRQQLFGDDDDFLSGRLRALALDHFLQVKPVDEVDRHIGGEIVFKDLVHGHDVGMHDLGQIARLAHEKLNHRAEFGGMRPRPRRDDGFRPAAERAGEAFLDDHIAIKAVLGQIGDAKAAAVQITDDGILAAQKLGSGRKLVDDIIQIVGLSLDSLLLRHHALPSRPYPAPCDMPALVALKQKTDIASLNRASSTCAHQSTSSWLVVDDGENGAVGWNLEGSELCCRSRRRAGKTPEWGAGQEWIDRLKPHDCHLKQSVSRMLL